MDDTFEVTDDRGPEAQGPGADDPGDHDDPPFVTGQALTDRLDALAEGADVPPAVGDAMVRVQQRLVHAGYSYVAGNAHRWPRGAVQLSKGHSTILLAPWLGAERSGGLVDAWDVFGRTFGANAGLMLMGAETIDCQDVQGFFDATKGIAAYLDVQCKTFRLRRKWSLTTDELLPLTKKNLQRLLGKAHRKAERIDCRARLIQDMHDMHETAAFMARSRRLAGGAGRPMGAMAIAAVCVGLFAAMVIASGIEALSSPSIDDLLTWGANYGPLVRAGQWWRIITCGFVHIGFIHLLFNMYVLWHFGAYLEVFQGRWRSVAFFLFSVVTASLASLWWNPTIVSAGASGGVFGQSGALAALVVRYRHDFPPQLRQGLRKMLWTFLFYNGFFLVVPVIDGAAHVGGLIGGFAIGLVLSRSPVKADWPGMRAWLAAGGLVVGLAAFANYAVQCVPPDAPLRPVTAKDLGDPARWGNAIMIEFTLDLCQRLEQEQQHTISRAVKHYQNALRQPDDRDIAADGIGECLALLQIYTSGTVMPEEHSTEETDRLASYYQRLLTLRIKYCGILLANLRSPDKMTDLTDVEMDIAVVRQLFKDELASVRKLLEKRLAR